MYKRILVPIDGSDTAARGLAEAITLARDLKATLRLLNLTSDFVLMVEMSNVIDYEKFREGLNQVGRRLPSATGSPWCCTDSQRADLLLHLRAGPEGLVSNFEEHRKQAAEGQSDEATG